MTRSSRTAAWPCAAVALSALLSLPVLPAAAQVEDDPVQTLVDRLTLDEFKAAIQGLARFGDRRQGTRRNSTAVDWIESRLTDFGCAHVERLLYSYSPPPPRRPGARRAGGPSPGLNDDTGTSTGGRVGRRGRSAGGSTIFGYRGPTGVNRDITAQPDERIRELNREEPSGEERSQVYCTKVGATRPDEMYIVGAHMDGHGVNEAVDDNASGSALVMELARIMSAPDIKTERSIRFVLWNNEETGLNGARAYVEQRRDLQGIEDPPGSGRFPEPRWLGMIQHDMILWDHGAPGPDGRVSRDQRQEADVNVEFQANSEMASQSMELAFFFKAANERYATDYPAAVGPHMTNTDSTPFMHLIASISLRENERGAQVGAGWNPHWHQPTDVWTTYTDDDFRLGLNAAQTTLAAVAQLTGARVVR